MTDMTRIPVDELEGRELDAAVAEEVMGWDVSWTVDTPVAHEAQEVDPEAVFPHGPSPAPVPHYSTDIAAAWEVVARVAEVVTTPGFDLKLHIGHWPPDGEEDQWLASFGAKNYPDDTWSEATAPTAPEAISRAALKAVRS